MKKDDAPLDMQDESDRARSIRESAEKEDSPLSDISTATPRPAGVSTDEPASRGGARHQGQGRVPVPTSMDQHESSLDARVRLKFSEGEELGPEEKGFLASLPAEKEVAPQDVGPDTAEPKPFARTRQQAGEDKAQ